MRPTIGFQSAQWPHFALLLVACVAAYSNNFEHAFFLDDFHVLVNNPGIRSLSNIPRYFVDPSTFTSLRANVDYRPILQATYALNYQMGGYNTWWWHLTQIMLHAVCVIGIYLLCRRVLQQSKEGADPEVVRWVPLVTAMVFALHPTASGVVNYLSARSSLLAAAFLLPSLLLYMVPRQDARYRRIPWLAALFFALALFTKVEAIAALGVFALYEVWQTRVASKEPGGFLSDLRTTTNGGTLRRISPMLAIAAFYFVVRQVVLAPYDLAEARRGVGVTSFQYLLTQTVVWWHYVAKWFMPVDLVADYGNYPVYRSILQGPVLLAVGGWIIVAAFLVANWKTRPYLLFLALSALALISPTSSVAPLAEMLNEHRPYLPIAVLSLTWMIPLATAALGAIQGRTTSRALAIGGITLAMLGLGSMTLQRNLAYATDRGYLEDIVAKAPSGRALNNYGLIFMQEGDYERALSLFQQALEYTPTWHIVHVNLGIIYGELEDPARALEHFDLAVRYDMYSGEGLSWRGEFFLEEGRYREAANDFEAARPRSLEHYRLCRGLATAYAGLGDVTRSLEETRRCLEIDPAQTAADIVKISKPFFDESNLAAAGLQYFEQLDAILPNTWWVHANIATLASRVGDSARADAAFARAESLRN